MPIALSWSRVSDFLQCRKKFHLKYIAKAFPQEDASKSVHLVKGAEMHKQLENYVYDKLNGNDASGKHYSPAIKDTLPMVDRILRAFHTVRPESQFAVNADWKQVEWFAKDTAWRAIMDLSAVNGPQALIIDWKTGKVQDYGTEDEEPGQLHLSGAMGMDLFGVDEVTVFYAFVEHKEKRPREGLKLTRAKDYADIRGYFTQVYDTVNSEVEWAPRINQYCNYCPATKAQCKFSKKMA
jgi:hypothetical protein